MDLEQTLALISQQREVTMTATFHGCEQTHDTRTGAAAASAVREFAHDHMVGNVVVQFGLWFSTVIIFSIRDGKIVGYRGF